MSENNGRIHDRPHFFKFATHQTALKIIESKSLKWSSPIAYNDPFDHQAGFVLDLEEKSFAHLLTDSMLRIIFTDTPVNVGASKLFTKLLLLSRYARDRLPREEMSIQLYEAALHVAKNITEGIDDFNTAIHSELLHSRVLCVSEEINNVVMWSHYADKHRGVAFQLGCIENLDNRLLAAQPVVYTDRFIAFPSALEYAQHLTGERPINMVALIWKIAYTKHLDWAYEKEWRVRIPLLNENPGTDFTFYDEPTEVFQALYLGCRMEPSHIESVVQVATKVLPHIKIYRSVQSRTSYSLSFELIKGA